VWVLSYIYILSGATNTTKFKTIKQQLSNTYYNSSNYILTSSRKLKVTVGTNLSLKQEVGGETRAQTLAKMNQHEPNMVTENSLELVVASGEDGLAWARDDSRKTGWSW
jgi:hypothetical protein